MTWNQQANTISTDSKIQFCMSELGTTLSEFDL